MQLPINLERITTEKRVGKYACGGDYSKKCNQLNEKGVSSQHFLNIIE